MAEADRAPWFWGGGAVLALTVGGIAIATVNTTVYSPEAQVQRYLDALAAGDGGTALAFAGGNSVAVAESGTATTGAAAGAATALLQGEPLTAGIAALGEPTVTRHQAAPEDGAADGSAVVTVAYSVDGADHSTEFTVEHTGRDWLFFDRWRMAPVPLQTVRVIPANLPPEAASGPVTAVVNGVETALVPEDGGTEPGQDFAVLPPFVVDAAFDSTFLTADPARWVVDAVPPAGAGRPAPVPLELDLRYTDAVAAEVDRQLKTYLTGCTEQQVLNPAGCPLGYDTVNRIPPETIRWSIAGDPSATVVPLPAAGADPTMMEPLQAEAELTLQEIDLVTGQQQPVVYRSPFTVAADLAVTGESVKLTPRMP